MKKRMSTLFSLIRRDKYLLTDVLAYLSVLPHLHVLLPMPGVLLAFRIFAGAGHAQRGVGGLCWFEQFCEFDLLLATAA